MQTVAVVGYAAAGVGGGLLAAAVAFAPSFAVRAGRRPLLRPAPGQRRACRRSSPGPGRPPSAPSPGRPSRSGWPSAHLWQAGLLALAALWLIGLRRGVVSGIVGAAGLGVIASWRRAVG